MGDPSTAHLSVDPILNLTGQPYAYANDDPVDNVDPSGLSFETGFVSFGESFGVTFMFGLTKYLRNEDENALDLTDIGNPHSD
jgi:hypothetical protein